MVSFTNPIKASAHCDGPCGVYDPASARIAAEAVQSMTTKMLALEHPDSSNTAAMAGFLNTMSRYASIKEEQAHQTKSELLLLWTELYHILPSILLSNQIQRIRKTLKNMELIYYN